MGKYKDYDERKKCLVIIKIEEKMFLCFYFRFEDIKNLLRSVFYLS